MAYKEWKAAVFRLLSPLPGLLSEQDYPTVDFVHMHRMGLNPERAAEVARAVNVFTKPEYKQRSDV